MKLFFAVFGMFLLTALLPYARCAVKRFAAAVKLRRTARRNGWVFTPSRFLWFFAPNGGTKPDCFLRGKTERGERIYAVKLWASLFRMQNAYFIGDDPQTVKYRRIIPLAGRFGGKYGWEFDEIAEATGGGINMITESRERKREAVDYRAGVGGGADVFPILLFCPAPLNVAEARVIPLSHTTVERPPMFTKLPETTLETRRLFDGDLLHGREYVYSTAAFLSELSYPHLGA